MHSRAVSSAVANPSSSQTASSCFPPASNADPRVLHSPLKGEPLIPLAEAVKRFPGSRGAIHTHPATLVRWILKGVKSVEGRTVRLEAIRCGYRWLTSEAALLRFFEALAATPNPTPPSHTPAERKRAAEAAGRRLEAAGA